jgi:FMN phosphatase YigB (HAD superfamily)
VAVVTNGEPAQRAKLEATDLIAADMAGGRGAGLRTIWMARGRTGDPSEPPPDAVADTIAGAVDIIVGSDPG